MLGQLILGVYDGLRGAAYLASRPRLWKWVLAPALVAAALLVVAVGAILSALDGPVERLAALFPGSWADEVLLVVAGIVLAIASASIFIALAALIAAPFNEALSESIEEHETGVPAPRFSLVRFLADLAIGVAHAARRVIVYVVVMGTLLVVGVAVPVVGTAVAGVLGAIATARFASYDAFDAIWARRHYRYRAKVGYLREHRWRTLGMGAVVAVMLVVPGLNLVGLAVGATAATLRVVDQDRSRARAVQKTSPS